MMYFELRATLRKQRGSFYLYGVPFEAGKQSANEPKWGLLIIFILRNVKTVYQMDKELFIDKMQQRMDALKDLMDRDYCGNLTGLNEAYREVKWIKEAAERGEFNET